MQENIEEREKCSEKLKEMQKYLPFLDYMIDKIQNKSNETFLANQLGKFQVLRSIVVEEERYSWDAIVKAESVIEKLISRLGFKEQIEKSKEPSLHADDILHKTSMAASISVVPSSTTTVPVATITNSSVEAKKEDLPTRTVDIIMKSLQISVESSINKRTSKDSDFSSCLTKQPLYSVDDKMKTVVDKDLPGYDLGNYSSSSGKMPVNAPPGGGVEQPLSGGDLLSSSRERLLKSLQNRLFPGRSLSDPSSLNQSEKSSEPHCIGVFSRNTTIVSEQKRQCDSTAASIEPRSTPIKCFEKVTPDPLKFVHSAEKTRTDLSNNPGDVNFKQRLKEKLSTVINEVYRVPGKSVGGSLRSLKEPKELKETKERRKSLVIEDDELFRPDVVVQTGGNRCSNISQSRLSTESKIQSNLSKTEEKNSENISVKNNTDNSERISHKSQSDSSEKTSHKSHSDNSGKTAHKSHSDHSEKTHKSHSEKNEKNSHKSHSGSSEKTSHKSHSDHSERSSHKSHSGNSEKTSHKSHSDKNEKNSHKSHSDHSERSSHKSHSDNSEKTHKSRSDNSEKTSHKSHSEHSEKRDKKRSSKNSKNSDNHGHKKESSKHDKSQEKNSAGRSKSGEKKSSSTTGEKNVEGERTKEKLQSPPPHLSKSKLEESRKTSTTTTSKVCTIDIDSEVADDTFSSKNSKAKSQDISKSCSSDFVSAKNPLVEQKRNLPLLEKIQDKRDNLDETVEDNEDEEYAIELIEETTPKTFPPKKKKGLLELPLPIMDELFDDISSIESFESQTSPRDSRLSELPDQTENNKSKPESNLIVISETKESAKELQSSSNMNLSKDNNQSSKHNPPTDNKTTHQKIDPRTGKPVSFRGFQEGNQNPQYTNRLTIEIEPRNTTNLTVNPSSTKDTSKLLSPSSSEARSYAEYKRRKLLEQKNATQAEETQQEGQKVTHNHEVSSNNGHWGFKDQKQTNSYNPSSVYDSRQRRSFDSLEKKEKRNSHEGKKEKTRHSFNSDESISPLEELYSEVKPQTGRGYGVQRFTTPKRTSESFLHRSPPYTTTIPILSPNSEVKIPNTQSKITSNKEAKDPVVIEVILDSGSKEKTPKEKTDKNTLPKESEKDKSKAVITIELEKSKTSLGPEKENVKTLGNKKEKEPVKTIERESGKHPSVLCSSGPKQNESCVESETKKDESLRITKQKKSDSLPQNICTTSSETKKVNHTECEKTEINKSNSLISETKNSVGKPASTPNDSEKTPLESTILPAETKDTKESEKPAKAVSSIDLCNDKTDAVENPSSSKNDVEEEIVILTEAKKTVESLRKCEAEIVECDSSVEASAINENLLGKESSAPGDKTNVLSKEEITQEFVEALIRKSFQSGEGKLLLAQVKLFEEFARKLNSKKLKTIQKIINSESESSSSSSSSSPSEDEKKKKKSKKSEERSRKIKKRKKKTKLKKKKKASSVSSYSSTSSSSSSESEDSSDEESLHVKKKKKEKNAEVTQKHQSNPEEKAKRRESTSKRKSEKKQKNLGGNSSKGKSRRRKQKEKLLEKMLEKSSDNEEENEVTTDNPSEVLAKENESKNKPRKGKTELDRLHEDIRSMFISEGVVTATGQRMCRILKESGGNMNNLDIVKESAKMVKEEKLKKVRTRPGSRNSRGTNSGSSQSRSSSSGQSIDSERTSEFSQENYDYEREIEEDVKLKLKPVVALQRVDLDNLGYGIKVSNDCVSFSRMRGRNTAIRRTSLRGETPNQLPPNVQLRKVFLARNKRKFDRLKFTRCKKIHVRKKLTDIIEKLPLKMSKMKYLQMSDLKRDNIQLDRRARGKSSEYNQPFMKLTNWLNYAFDRTKKTYNCKLCPRITQHITGHYKASHPEHEVLISRLSLQEARKAKADSKRNGFYETFPAYTDLAEAMKQKVQALMRRSVSYNCRMCWASKITDINSFASHVSAHTGEYRFQCPDGECNLQTFSLDDMKFHIISKHTNSKLEYYSKITELFPLCTDGSQVFGFLCSRCHYVQMCRENLEKHIKNHEYSEKARIIKINMSSKGFGTNGKSSSDSKGSSNYASENEEGTNKKIVTQKKNLKSRQTASVGVAVSTASDEEEIKKRKLATSSIEPDKDVVSDKTKKTKNDANNPVTLEQMDDSSIEEIYVVKKNNAFQQNIKGDNTQVVENCSLDIECESSQDAEGSNTQDVEDISLDTGGESSQDAEISNIQGEDSSRDVEKENTWESGLSSVVVTEDSENSSSLGSVGTLSKKKKENPPKPCLKLKVGPLEAQLFENLEVLYECYVKGCIFTTRAYDLFEIHIKISHWKVRWDGICQICGNGENTETARESNLQLLTALRHLKLHEREKEKGGKLSPENFLKELNLLNGSNEAASHEKELTAEETEIQSGSEVSDEEQGEEKTNEKNQDSENPFPVKPLLRVRNFAGDRLSTPKAEEMVASKEEQSKTSQNSSMMFTIQNVRSLREILPKGSEQRELKITDVCSVKEQVPQSPPVGSPQKTILLRSCPTRKIAIRPKINPTVTVDVGQVNVVQSPVVRPVMLSPIPNNAPIRILSVKPIGVPGETVLGANVLPVIHTSLATPIPNVQTVSPVPSVSNVISISTVASASAVPTVSTVLSLSNVLPVSTVPSSSNVPTVSTVFSVSNVPNFSTVLSIPTVSTITVPSVSTVATVSTVPTVQTLTKGASTTLVAVTRPPKLRPCNETSLETNVEGTQTEGLTVITTPPPMSKYPAGSQSTILSPTAHLLKTPLDDEETEERRTINSQKLNNLLAKKRSVKDSKIYHTMLTKKKLCHLFKCMGIECSFTCNDQYVFTQHIGLHEAQRRLKKSKGLKTFYIKFGNKAKKAYYWQQCAYCCDVLGGPSCSLSRHILQEHGHCTYQCGFCFYRAVSYSYVEVHQNLAHTQILKKTRRIVFKCKALNPAPTQAAALEKYGRRQSVRPYNCDQCGRKFFITEEFVNHLSTTHQSVTAYTCHICKNLCFKINRLINHYKLHSYSTFQCSYCLHGTETAKEMMFHLCNFHFSEPPVMYARSLDDDQKSSGSVSTLESLKVVSCDNDNVSFDCLIEEDSDDEKVPAADDSADLSAIAAELGISTDSNESSGAIGSPLMQELAAIGDQKNKGVSLKCLLPNAEFSSENEIEIDESSVLISSGLKPSADDSDDNDLNIPLGQLPVEIFSVNSEESSEKEPEPETETETTDTNANVNEITSNNQQNQSPAAVENKTSSHPSTVTYPAAVHKLPPVVLSRSSSSKGSCVPLKSILLVRKKSLDKDTPNESAEGEKESTKETSDNLSEKSTSPANKAEKSPKESNSSSIVDVVSLSKPENEKKTKPKTVDKSATPSDKNEKPEGNSNQNSKSLLKPPIIRVQDYFSDENTKPSEPPSDEKKDSETKETSEDSDKQEEKCPSPEVIILEEEKTQNIVTVVLDSDDETEGKVADAKDSTPSKPLSKGGAVVQKKEESKDKTETKKNSSRKQTKKQTSTEEKVSFLKRLISKSLCSSDIETTEDMEENKEEKKKLMKKQEVSEIPKEEVKKDSLEVVNENSKRLVKKSPKLLDSESSKTVTPELRTFGRPRTRFGPREVKKEITDETIKVEGDEVKKEDHGKGKKFLEGLVGKELFVCGNERCDFAAETEFSLKDHLLVCDLSRDSTMLVCPHCYRQMKYFQTYLEHIKYHGEKKFQCGLCSFSSAVDSSTTKHVRVKHRCTLTKMIPKPGNDGHFTCYPKNYKVHTVDFAVNGYSPGDEDKLPLQSVYQVNVKCAKCPYFTKVRSNMVRHLKIHLKSVQTEGSVVVPSTAPTNPVPCLESKERMFDKMTNLAASSQMAHAKEKTIMDGLSSEEEAKLPQFVSEQMRYKCCLPDCNYITIDDGMLKHHIKALHGEINYYSCPHCKTSVHVDVRNVTLDKIGNHLKHHDAKLYKCAHCIYFHYLKSVVEKHTIEKHPDRRYLVYTIREPKTETPTEEESSSNDSAMRVWKCGMCHDYKTPSKAMLTDHLLKNHNTRSKYKCQLCTLKANTYQNIVSHFSSKHPGEKVEYIRTYSVDKITGSLDCSGNSSGADSSNEHFDTTPLWQRGAPRIRHIRGILIEEEEIKTKKSKRISLDESESDTSVDKVKENMFYCPLCTNKKKPFYTRNEDFFRTHLYQELNYQQFACILCGKMFVDKRDFDRHHSRLHPDKSQSFKQTTEDHEIKFWVDQVIEKRKQQMEERKRKLSSGESSGEPVPPKKKKEG